MKGDYDTYWKKTGGQALSADFKDLIIKMFAYDGKDRPTLAELAAHPWLQADCNVKKIQNSLLADLAEKRVEATSASSASKGQNRGEEMNDLILVEQKGQNWTFHDQRVYPRRCARRHV